MIKKRFNCNSVKHGIFAQLVLKGDPLGEDRNDFGELLSTLHDSIRPTDGFEVLLVEKLGILFYRLARVYKADIKVAPSLFKRVAEEVRQPRVQTAWVSPDDEVLVVAKNNSSSLIARYESGIERQIERTLKQLEVYRSTRGANSIPALASAGEIVHAEG